MPPTSRSALGSLKGPLMKVAQLLATIPDALPEEYAEELAQAPVQRAADGLVLRQAPHGERARAGLAEAGSRASSTRPRAPPRSARCIARLGARRQSLACKLQYPDMDSAVEADLQQLKLIMALYERYDRAIATDEIHAEIAARLHEELDYAREAAHMRASTA